MKSKILSFFMTVALIITIMPQMVLGANGPCSDEYPPAYVGLFSESASKYIFSNFSQDKVEKVKEEITKVQEALKGDDTDSIKSASEALTNAFYEMSAELYKQAEAANNQNAAGNGESGKVNDDGTVNADYEVFDEGDNK